MFCDNFSFLEITNCVLSDSFADGGEGQYDGGSSCGAGGSALGGGICFSSDSGGRLCCSIIKSNLAYGGEATQLLIQCQSFPLRPRL